MKEERPSLSDFIVEQALNYYLWLLTLTLSLSSSIIFFKLYLNSRGTPLGRGAFYVSINSILWTIAIGFLSLWVSSMAMLGAPAWIFLSLTSAAGIASSIGAYYRAQIAGLLNPRGEEKTHIALCYSLGILAVLVAVVNDVLLAVGSRFLNIGVNGMSILGSLGIILAAGSIIALTLPKLPNKKIAFVSALFASVIGLAAIAGYSFGIRFLYSPFAGKPVSDLTAVGFIVAGLWVLLSLKRGDKAWTARFIPPACVLLISVLAIIGYIVNMPVLFNGGTTMKLSVPTAFSFLLLSSAQLWYSWRR